MFPTMGRRLDVGTDQLPDASFDDLIEPLNIYKIVLDYNELFVKVPLAADSFLEKTSSTSGSAFEFLEEVPRRRTTPTPSPYEGQSIIEA